MGTTRAHRRLLTLVVATSAVLAVALPACKNPADTPECKKWQAFYKMFEGDPSAQGFLLNGRPDGCPIPP